VTAYFAARPAQSRLAAAPVMCPAGSHQNDFGFVDQFMRLMLDAHLDRQSLSSIVGAAPVMDAVGLAAALVHRGLARCACRPRARQNGRGEASRMASTSSGKNSTAPSRRPSRC